MLKISVVTTVLNAAPYVEQTVRSVIGQNDPNLEYIVLDAGSTDGTFEKLDHFAQEISILESSPDKGQYHAIQAGLSRSSGDIMAWINADDTYLPWAFSVVREIFANFPEVAWIIGLPAHVNRRGQMTRLAGQAGSYPRQYIQNGWFRPPLAGYLQQESIFWRRSLWDAAGGRLDLALEYAADFELWTRFSSSADLVAVSVPLAAFRHRRGEQRSSLGIEEYEREVQQVCSQRARPPSLWNSISRANHATRWLYATLQWKRSPLIQYYRDEDRWILTNQLRPISQMSLPNLICDYATQRAGKGAR
ncbi:MAG: glycosyltransferase [Burkholderiales bacterium]|nr:glycosyltransferase [Burkholderiales bacterium]